jgi:acyl-CoA synthetase (AMP-forming)/AMP-acid ligase II
MSTSRGTWYYTGDFGRLSEGGFIHLTGRVSNRIRRGGASIAAEEVERVLCQHPLVMDAAVVGRPSPEMGQDVIAFVVLRSGLDVQELEAHCRRHLARAKVPLEFHIVQSFARNPVGRIMRRALLESVMPQPMTVRDGLDEYR